MHTGEAAEEIETHVALHATTGTIASVGLVEKEVLCEHQTTAGMCSTPAAELTW